MKKSLLIILSALIILAAVPFSASAASTEGYFTYEVSGGQAIITDADENISGYVIIPETLGGYPVTAIGANAFDYCSKITKLGVPGCVKTIGKSAFQYTSGLTEVIFKSGVTTIGEYCFDSSGVVKIHLPLTVDTLGYAAWHKRSVAVFYEGTEEQLQQINRPNKGNIEDIFRNANISYNQTIPAIENSSAPSNPGNNDGGNDNSNGDTGFSIGDIFSWFISFITFIWNFISQLIAA
ncbi:MAG: leucine-rich repeat domain-containing protein [Clostridia bacterium]|nr:leucine-rich repeat domain-containing protein [Clostridia bacterium]